MSPLSLFTLPFLCTASVLSTVFSIQCNEKQYAWPYVDPKHCCDKCPPGYYMPQDPNTSCQNVCKPCEEGRYMETYNLKTYCYFCECKKQNMEVKINCTSTRNAVCDCKAGYRWNDQERTMCVKIQSTKPTLPRPTTLPRPSTSETRPLCSCNPDENMEVKKNCTSTRNAVCGCKAGYRCNDDECTMCVKIQSTKPTLPRPTTGVVLKHETIGKEKTVWFLVITGLMSAVIVLVVATKIKPLLHWAKFSQETAPTKPAAGAAQPLSQEDRDVSKPVQEVCGECDQLTDLFMKV